MLKFGLVDKIFQRGTLIGSQYIHHFIRQYSYINMFWQRVFFFFGDILHYRFNYWQGKYSSSMHLLNIGHLLSITRMCWKNTIYLNLFYTANPCIYSLFLNYLNVNYRILRVNKFMKSCISISNNYKTKKLSWLHHFYSCYCYLSNFIVTAMGADLLSA